MQFPTTKTTTTTKPKPNPVQRYVCASVGAICPLSGPELLVAITPVRATLSFLDKCLGAQTVGPGPSWPESLALILRQTKGREDVIVVCVCLCVSVSMCLCGPCGLGILLLLLLLLLLLSFCFVSIKKSDRVAAGQGSCCYKTDSMFSHHSWSSRL